MLQIFNVFNVKVKEKIVKKFIQNKLDICESLTIDHFFSLNEFLPHFFKMNLQDESFLHFMENLTLMPGP